MQRIDEHAHSRDVGTGRDLCDAGQRDIARRREKGDEPGDRGDEPLCARLFAGRNEGQTDEQHDQSQGKVQRDRGEIPAHQDERVLVHADEGRPDGAEAGHRRHYRLPAGMLIWLDALRSTF